MRCPLSRFYGHVMKSSEKILGFYAQIMWPNLYMDKASMPITVGESPLHKIAEKIAKELLGEDMEFDFDMLISKVKIKIKTRESDRNRQK